MRCNLSLKFSSYTHNLAYFKCKHLQVVVDTLMDLKKAHDSKIDILPENQQEEHSKKFLVEEGSKFLVNIEKLITQYGDGKGHSVGNSLTWPDLYIFDVMTRFPVKLATFIDKYPHINKVVKETEAHPHVAAWLKKRPVTKW